MKTINFLMNKVILTNKFLYCLIGVQLLLVLLKGISVILVPWWVVVLPILIYTSLIVGIFARFGFGLMKK